MTTTSTDHRADQDSAGSGGLRLLDVTLTLGDGDTAVTALDHVDLSVAPGEFVAVVGPSGSGKSSLLAVAGGLQRPTAGTVHVAGAELTALRDKERTATRRRHVGFVFQQSNLLASSPSGNSSCCPCTSTAASTTRPGPAPANSSRRSGSRTVPAPARTSCREGNASGQDWHAR